MTRRTHILLFLATVLAFHPSSAPGVVVYRVGSPFSEAEKDSLEGIGIDFEEIPWSASQLQEALEPDSLKAGSLQPNYFDEDEDIAATLLTRDGWVGVKNFANVDRLLGQVLVDQDPATAHTWPAIAPESFNVATGFSNEVRNTEQVTFDLGGRFLVREVRLRPSPEFPEHFLEWIQIGVSDRGFHAGNSVPDFPAIAEVKENTEPEIRVVLDSPVSTEAIQLRVLRQTPKEIGIADFELYGGGFVSRASYESDIIALDDIASWGEIRSSGTARPRGPGRYPHPFGDGPAAGFLLGSPPRAAGQRQVSPRRRRPGPCGVQAPVRQAVRCAQTGGRAGPGYSRYRELELLVQSLPVREHRRSCRYRIAGSAAVFSDQSGFLVHHRRRRQDRFHRIQGVVPPGGERARGGDFPERHRDRQADPFHLFHQAGNRPRRRQLRRAWRSRPLPVSSRSIPCASTRGTRRNSAGRCTKTAWGSTCCSRAN